MLISRLVASWIKLEEEIDGECERADCVLMWED